MGEVQETIASRKCQRFDVNFTKDFSRRSKADRCRSKSEMGASQSPASEESRISFPKSPNEEARYSRAFRLYSRSTVNE